MGTWCCNNLVAAPRDPLDHAALIERLRPGIRSRLTSYRRHLWQHTCIYLKSKHCTGFCNGLWPARYKTDVFLVTHTCTHIYIYTYTHTYGRNQTLNPAAHTHRKVITTNVAHIHVSHNCGSKLHISCVNRRLAWSYRTHSATVLCCSCNDWRRDYWLFTVQHYSTYNNTQ